jgi:hypothetical protein
MGNRKWRIENGEWGVGNRNMVIDGGFFKGLAVYEYGGQFSFSHSMVGSIKRIAMSLTSSVS